MFGRKNDTENILSGQAQIDKRKEIMNRLNALIFKWNPERIDESNISETILNDLKTASRILNDICIERSNSAMVEIYYATLINNIELIEQRQYSDKFKIRSRLDFDSNSNELLEAAKKILNASQKWKECE